uniref:Glycosyl transferases group 1 n=1 Tax=Candidatus Kentrum sp. DK TaxID=2126562 RepID=A0A450SWV1_9GAMM|nr:MAG: Glycosyl transferases group 1 [Candidatus Kentron sp. DK]
MAENQLDATGDDKIVVGIILDRRGDPPFVSVKKLWNGVVALLSDCFTVRVYSVDRFDINCDNDAFRAFAKGINVLVLLSPYYSLDRNIARAPAVILSLGSLHKGGYWLSKNRASIRQGDMLVLNSRSCQHILDTTVPSYPLSTALIPLGIDTGVFRPRTDKKAIRARHNIPEDAFVLVYSGRINIQKNAHLLLSVMDGLRESDDIPDGNAHLVLVGFFDDFYIPEFSEKTPPQSRAAFHRLLELLGVGDRVTVIPHQDDPDRLSEILACADLGITLGTQIGENFGYTLVEMQSCGLPVVCSAWAGFQDTVRHGVTGFQVNTALTDYGVRVNYEQAAAYVKLLMEDRARLATMAEAARDHAREYDTSAFGRRLHRAVEASAARALGNELSEADFSFSPTLARYHRLLDGYGESHHVSWEHLYPRRDLDSYRQIISCCVSYDASEVRWHSDDRIAKGFDWVMESADRIVYRDPRWTPALELEGIAFSPDELEVLWRVDQGMRRVGDLMAHLREDDISALLGKLADKGIILPATRTH